MVSENNRPYNRDGRSIRYWIESRILPNAEISHDRERKI